MAKKTIFLVMVILWAVVSVHGHGHKKVKLTRVQALTFVRDEYTTGRRNAPIPQIECVGGSAAGEYVPGTIQCKNVGHDGIDVNWKCDAELPKKYILGRTDVACEGYSHPDDPYILHGSCGVEFTLDHNPAYREEASKEESTGWFSRWTAPQSQRSSSDTADDVPEYRAPASDPQAATKASLWGSPWVLASIFLLMYCCCGRKRHSPAYEEQPPVNAQQAQAGASAYMPRPDPVSPPPPAYANPTAAPGAPSAHQAPQGSDSGPGFWSGATIGGLAGYMAGRSNNAPADAASRAAAEQAAREREEAERRAREEAARQASASRPSSSWWNWSGPTFHSSTRSSSSSTRSSGWSSRSSGRSSRSSGGGMHKSTGHGRTNRR